MAVEVNRGPNVYTVKYTNEMGGVGFVDITAAGTWAAQQQFNKDYPGATVVTIYKKR